MSVHSPESFELPEDFGPGSVWVDRVATRQYVGHTQSGVEIPIGLEEGRVSPGELLKLALIGCAGMSMDHSVARRLGEDFAARLYAHGTSDEKDDRYHEIDETIQLDLSGLEEREREKLAAVIDRVIDAACTIQRTVVPGAEVRHTITDAHSAGAAASHEEEK